MRLSFLSSAPLPAQVKPPVLKEKRPSPPTSGGGGSFDLRRRVNSDVRCCSYLTKYGIPRSCAANPLSKGNDLYRWDKPVSSFRRRKSKPYPRAPKSSHRVSWWPTNCSHLSLYDRATSHQLTCDTTVTT